MRIQTRAFLLIVGLVFVLSAPAFGADVAKIGVIDFQKILKESKAGQAVQAAMEKQGREMEADLKKRGNAIDALTQQLDSDAMVMDKDKRDEKQRELEIKRYDFQSLQKKYQSKLRDLQTTYMQKLQSDVVTLVNKIGKRDGYLLIIDKNAAVYNPGSIDITDQLIKEYNESFDGKLQ